MYSLPCQTWRNVLHLSVQISCVIYWDLLAVVSSRQGGDANGVFCLHITCWVRCLLTDAVSTVMPIRMKVIYLLFIKQQMYFCFLPEIAINLSGKQTFFWWISIKQKCCLCFGVLGELPLNPMPVHYILTGVFLNGF